MNGSFSLWTTVAAASIAVVITVRNMIIANLEGTNYIKDIKNTFKKIKNTHKGNKSDGNM